MNAARTLLRGLDGNTDWTIAYDHGRPADGLITGHPRGAAVTEALERITAAAQAAGIPVRRIGPAPAPDAVADLVRDVFGPNPRMLAVLVDIDRVAADSGPSTTRRLHDLIAHPGRNTGIIATAPTVHGDFAYLGATQSARTPDPVLA